MKKLYILAMLALSTSVYGQSIKNSAMAVPEGPQRHAPGALTRADSTRLIGYLDVMYTLTDAANRTYYINHLWPDTSVVQLYSTGLSTPFIHSIGQVLDPAAANLINYGSAILPISQWQPFTVDSVFIPYRYSRVQNGNPDTVIVQYYANDEVLLQYDYNVNASGATVWYDPQTQKGTNYSQQQMVMLDQDDTASITKFLSLPVGITVSPENKFAVTVTYKPGNPYNAGDTLFVASDVTANVVNPVNRFSVFDLEVTDMSNVMKGDYNMELNALTSHRYSTNDSVQMAPGTTWATGANPVKYDMDVYFEITYDADAVGIETANANNTLQLFPNPVSDRLQFNTALEGAAVVSIKNVLGQTIVSYSETVSKGKFLDLNVAALTSGVYIVEVATANRIAAAQFVKN